MPLIVGNFFLEVCDVIRALLGTDFLVTQLSRLCAKGSPKEALLFIQVLVGFRFVNRQSFKRFTCTDLGSFSRLQDSLAELLAKFR
ncbi:MAG: hypothetical protein P0119_00425 [Nitrospira sp.]|nr:hypothetical protein [Nitrospira sp.]